MKKYNLASVAARWEAICALLDGNDPGDFMLSFPEVRQVADLVAATQPIAPADGKSIKKSLNLLQRLNEHIVTVHLDMGGKDKYALGSKAHPIISEIKSFLSKSSQPIAPADGGSFCDCTVSGFTVSHKLGCEFYE